MKVAVISEYNIYTSIGGTETYVDLLLRKLVEDGISTVFITLGKSTDKNKTERKETDGITVYFLPDQKNSQQEIEQKRISWSWNYIEDILSAEKPDIVHVHTYTTFFNHHHFKALHKKNIPVFFTTHVPAHLCSTGDLIKNNRTPCSGKIGFQCIGCRFSFGFKKGITGILKGYYKSPLFLLTVIQKYNVQLICVSEWQKRLVALNGFPEEKVSVIRQAIEPFKLVKPQIQITQEPVHSTFSIGFLGRFSPEKGSSLLLDIIKICKEQNRFRFVLGIPAANSSEEEMNRLYELSSNNPGYITILDSVTPANKSGFFQEIDCLLIPSFFWETGPIVLLEALAFEKPVIGSGLAGIAEFKEEFPGSIKTFKWGDANDAVVQLGKIVEQKSVSFRDKQTMNRLIKKENEFSKKHIHLYQQALKQVDIR